MDFSLLLQPLLNPSFPSYRWYFLVPCSSLMIEGCFRAPWYLCVRAGRSAQRSSHAPRYCNNVGVTRLHRGWRGSLCKPLILNVKELKNIWWWARIVEVTFV